MKEKVTALTEARKAAGKARWEGVSKRARSRQMKAVRANGGGRPRSKERCFCGTYTLYTATQRGFDCCKRAGMHPGATPVAFCTEWYAMRRSRERKATPK